MSAPTFVAAGAGVGTDTSGAALSPACPASISAGDLLIIQTHWQGATIAPSTPAGWTLIDPSAPRVVGATSFRQWTFGKIADGSEGGTSIALGAPANTNGRFARIYQFTGVRNDTIANVVGGWGFGTASAAAVTDTAVTTPEADCLAVNLISEHDDNALGPFTGMTGGTWSEPVAEYTNAATATDGALQLQIATMASAGTIDGGSFTMSAVDAWGVVGFYIRGAAASGDVTITAPPLAGTGDLLTPAVSAGAIVVSPPLAGTGDLIAPGATGDANAVSPPLAAAGDLVAPAASTATTVTAPPLAASGDLIAPSVTGDANVTVPPLAGTGDLVAPAVSGNANVTAAPLVATGDLIEPGVSTGINVTVTVPPLAGAGTLVVPAVSTTANVTVSSIALAAVGALLPPTVTVVNPPPDVEPEPVSNQAFARAPSMSGSFARVDDTDDANFTRITTSGPAFTRVEPTPV